MEKAPGNKAVKRCKWYGRGKQALFPVKQVKYHLAKRVARRNGISPKKGIDTATNRNQHNTYQ